jgi:hypothetical protein
MPRSDQPQHRRRPGLPLGRAVRASAGVIGVVALLVPAAAHAGVASIRFGQAVSLRLPTGARFGAVKSASCAGAGSCTLAGGYTGSSGVSHAMVVTRSDGHWASAIKLLLPSNSRPTPDGDADAISCSRAGSCVAAGSYTVGSKLKGFTATESHGAWRRATEMKLPSNAALSTNVFIHGVACTGPGNCVVAGNYSDNLGHHRIMASTEFKGTWGRARELRAPADASPIEPVYLDSLACPGLGSCVAVGTYQDKPLHGLVFVATESGGTWHQATQLILPKDANTTDPDASVVSVACSGVGSCVAVGSYVDRMERLVPMSVAESGGTWARAQHVTRVPADAAARPSLTFMSVSCLRNGSCLGVGDYRKRGGGTGAMVMTRSGTRWISATQIRTPPDGATVAKQHAVAAAIGCSAAGFCAVAGSYQTAQGTRLMAATG